MPVLDKNCFCSSCLKIRTVYSNGSISEYSIEYWIDHGLNNPMFRVMVYDIIIHNLEINGGCPSCISYAKRTSGLRL